METKELDSGSTYAPVWSLDGSSSVQFLAIRPNHERNTDSLRSESKEDFYLGLIGRGTIIVRDI